MAGQRASSRTSVPRSALSPARRIEATDRVSRPVKTGEAVADRLRRQIVRGELRVGDRLPPEEELTTHFGIARTTLREALRILESQQLISIRRGRGGGPVVTMPEPDSLADGMAVLLQMKGTTVGDLDRARSLIEPQLAGELARHHSPDDLAVLDAAILQAAAAAKAGDHDGFAAAVVLVHEAIMERAGNDTLALFSRLLHQLVEQYYLRGAQAADVALMQRAVRSFRKFLRLVEAGDGEAAESHWRAHMAYTSERRAADDPLDLFDA